MSFTALYAAFRLLPGMAQLASLIGVIVFLLGLWGGFALWKQSLINEGYENAIKDVASRNQVAADSVREAVAKPRACRDHGGVWNAVNGMCGQE